MISENRSHELEPGGVCGEGLEGGTGRERWCNYNLKNRNKKIRNGKNRFL